MLPTINATTEHALKYDSKLPRNRFIQDFAILFFFGANEPRERKRDENRSKDHLKSGAELILTLKLCNIIIQS